MQDVAEKAVEIQAFTGKVGEVFQRRMHRAQQRLGERVKAAFDVRTQQVMSNAWWPSEIWRNWLQYSTDFAQRSILFWDTLRHRGNNWTEHERAGKPPVLHFDYEMVMDAREFERPVNYALVRIIPPKGVTVDAGRRPYVIIDPRAGHGPGIGGFKDDSQVGVALREGHPVYFVIFFPQPEPDQTLLDVCEAEARFIRKVHELHPESPKPVVTGNCQGGWAAMMLASSNPDDTGPIVINGAPMSYWGGAWRDGEGDNPMRYAGGLLGGTWMASLAADMGNGLFDGAWLVQNMENLNPANTFWDKYYHLFANIDTEAPRFLEFERWWGGFYLFNREEIEWIVRDLFVGNKLWSGEVRDKERKVFDLRSIRSPIVLFASLGDNITPPQQAFNWVADVYGSTEEIKTNGQTIVGLLHEDIGHLGIFVSGRVAKKEHSKIVSVMKAIEALPAGLYGMKIVEAKSDDGKPVYDVEFIERRLEDVIERLNRFERTDEKAFDAVARVAEYNQRRYELFARPFVQAFSNDATAEMGRDTHPLRLQRWLFSDGNPWMAWVKLMADIVHEKRHPAEPNNPFQLSEQVMSDLVSASLEYYRDVRDAMSEALFFQIYGNMFLLYGTEGKEEVHEGPRPEDPRELPYVREALEAMAEGGYPEALGRVAALLARHGEPIPLSKIQVKEDLIAEFRDLLPNLPRDQMRRIRGEQDIIVRYEPDKALESLPRLVKSKADRVRLLTLFDRLLSDARLVPNVKPEQRAMLNRIGQRLSVRPEEMPLSVGKQQ